MRSPLRRFAQTLALMVVAVPFEATAEPRARYNPDFPSPSAPYQRYPGWEPHSRPQAPYPYGTQRVIPWQRSYPQRPVVACDAYGRCWQQLPVYPQPRGYYRPGTYGNQAPRANQGRFVHRQNDVLCDRSTSVCYKDGRVDKTETRDAFGGRAADRADDLRDRFETSNLFVPQRGVACDRGRRACYVGDQPDYRLTQHYFGKRAAQALD